MFTARRIHYCWRSTFMSPFGAKKKNYYYYYYYSYCYYYDYYC